MKLTKYCYHIKVILKPLATTFLFRYNNKIIELYKAYLLDDLMKLQYALVS